MGKVIRNPIEARVVVHFEEGQPIYHIEDVSIHYGLSCEHGIAQRRGLPLYEVVNGEKVFSQEILNIVKDFIEEGLKQVDIHEGIPEEDSLLDYNGVPDNMTV